MLTGGLANAAKGGRAVALARGTLAFDVAGNAAGVGRGVADVDRQGGLTWQNGVQIVAGAAGIGGNYAGVRAATTRSVSNTRSRICVRSANPTLLTAGERRVAQYGRLWQEANVEKAIARHAGPNATSWRTATGKTIFENPATGRQVVIDDAGYFRIFQPKTIGSQQGQYLDMLGKVPSPARQVKGGAIKNVPLSGGDLNAETHFLIK